MKADNLTAGQNLRLPVSKDSNKIELVAPHLWGAFVYKMGPILKLYVTICRTFCGFSFSKNEALIIDYQIIASHFHLFDIAVCVANVSQMQCT